MFQFDKNGDKLKKELAIKMVCRSFGKLGPLFSESTGLKKVNLYFLLLNSQNSCLGSIFNICVTLRNLYGLDFEKCDL